MKKVLFTNMTMKDFTGSELGILSIAKYFNNIGWDVSIFTLEIGQPLLEKVPVLIKLFDLSRVGELEEEYDLIWSHQHPLLEYLLLNRKVKAKRVYYEAVSYRIPVDAFPCFYKKITMTGVASYRIKDEFFKIGFDTSKSYHFPNYATSEYFEKNVNINDEIKRIAIVSNHPPIELEEFADYASNRGVEVDIFGMHHKYTLITADLLSNYDVIISIGKTIFYSLALGIPSYTYDDLVSNGYITIDNFQTNYENNLAYSKEFNKKEAIDIYNEIFLQYDKVKSEVNELKKLAKKSFWLDEVMKKFMEELFSKPEMDYKTLYEEYKVQEYTSRMYVEDMAFAKSEIMRWYNKSLELGDLYQEEIKKSIAYHTQYNQVNDELTRVLNSKGWKFLERLRKIKKR